MVGLQKKDRVKKSKKVDVDEIEDLTMAFATEKKVYDKLALRIEMEVDLEKQEDVLRPWKTAEAEVKLDHTLFEFNQKQVGAFDVIKEIKKPLQEEQMAALSRNISEIVEKSPELPLAGLDAEVMGVIINDIMTVTMTALEKVFGDRRVGEGGVTATLVEGARQALMNPLENAVTSSCTNNSTSICVGNFSTCSTAGWWNTITSTASWSTRTGTCAGTCGASSLPRPSTASRNCCDYIIRSG